MIPLQNFSLWQGLFGLANIQQNGFLPPHVFLGYLNEVNNEMFTLYAEQFGRSQQLSDKLAPFVTSVNVPVALVPGSPFGLATLPVNYEYLCNVKILRPADTYECACNNDLPTLNDNGYIDPDIAAINARNAGANLVETRVFDIDNQRWNSALIHVFNSPTWDSPMCTQIASGTGVRQLKVAPKGISTIVLDYLRTPLQATFNYSIVDSIVIYDPTTSVNLEWSNTLENEFLYRMLKKYGLYVGQQAIVQMAEEYLKGLE